MLKYLFIAEYNDGSTYNQTPEDVSIKEPEKRSAFFDVDHTRLVKFSLVEQGTSNGHVYSVDLRDGHFEVDGVAFCMHEGLVAGLELIFFRRHTHTYTQSNVSTKEIDHEIVYRIGWKVKKNNAFQRVMEIN